MSNLVLLFSLFLNLLVNYSVYKNVYLSWLPILWLMSLTLLIFYVFKVDKPKINIAKKIKFKKRHLLTLIIILLPVLVRFVNLNIYRIHQDEFISAYISSQYNLKTSNFFAGIPEREGWVSQFPALYFTLQKIFFLLFGESPLTVKLSVFPYIFIVSVLLFVITKKVFSYTTAVISVILYSFFPVSIYFETLGLHFISSTAVFLAFFYFLIRFLRKNNIKLSILSGITCGFNYLFYLSSYIALPLGLLVYLITFLRYKKVSVIKNFLFFLLSFLLVISPFFIFILTQKNYLPVRFEDVSFIAKINAKDVKKRLAKEIVLDKAIQNLNDSIKSLYLNDIGGHGGYDFGRLAMFERFSLILFIVGAIISIFLLFKKIEILLVLVVTLTSFIFGMALTIPPPAYHRFSLAFPFLTMISALPAHILLTFKFISKKILYPLIFIFLSIYIVMSQGYFLKAVKQDIKNKHNDLAQLTIISYIRQNYSNRKIYIAAFPTISLKILFYFFDNTTNVIADYHQNLIDRFNSNEKYVYIILFPEEFSKKFAALDKNGKFIKGLSKEYVFFVN